MYTSHDNLLDTVLLNYYAGSKASFHAEIKLFCSPSHRYILIVLCPVCLASVLHGIALSVMPLPPVVPASCRLQHMPPPPVVPASCRLKHCHSRRSSDYVLMEDKQHVYLVADRTGNVKLSV